MDNSYLTCHNKVDGHDASQQHQDVEINGVEEVHFVVGEEEAAGGIAQSSAQDTSRSSIKRDDVVAREEETVGNHTEDDHGNDIVRDGGRPPILRGEVIIIAAVSF